ncbi:MAG: TonB-dependent siderophore receptor, partial [Rhodanobacter sp.]
LGQFAFVPAIDGAIVLALNAEIVLRRDALFRDIKGDGLTVDNRLNLDFDTGVLEHKGTVGVDYLWGKSRWHEQSGTASGIDIYNPVYGAVPNTSVFTAKSLQDIAASQVGLYAQDQIKYGKWIATLGVRQDWAWRDTKNRTTRINAKQTDDAFTWRGGLTYLSDSGLAPSVSYSQSFSPVVGSDRLGKAYVPEKGQQYEVGVKFQPAGYNSFITVSAFNLARQNVQTIDPVNTSFSVQTGEVRVRGLEIEGVAALDNGLSLTAAYTYNDAEISKTNIAAQKGNTPYRVPEHAASAWVNYDLQVAALQGLSMGVGVRYIGSTMGDDDNTFKVPAFTLVDAALRYDFGRAIAAAKGLTGSINVSNLFDKYYVPACFTVNACNYGSSRTIIGNLSYRW